MHYLFAVFNIQGMLWALFYLPVTGLILKRKFLLELGYQPLQLCDCLISIHGQEGSLRAIRAMEMWSGWAITAWATYGLQKPHEKSEEVHVVNLR